MDSLVSCEDSEICPGIWVPQVGSLLLFDLGFGNWVTLGILSVDDIFSVTFSSSCCFFFNLIVFLRITFLLCGPPLVWVSSQVEQNQSWLQQRILGFSETLKVPGEAFWQSSKIQAQELEHWVITEPPSLMHPCAADYMSRSRLGFSHLWNGANNSISLIGVVWDGLGWWLDQAMSMNPLWYLGVILSHFLLPLHHRHHHHHHHRHPHSRYDMGILSMAVPPCHGMNRDNRTLDVRPKGSLEVTVTGLDSS